MAIEILPKGKYNFKQNTGFDEEFSVMHLKLTDSSLKAIEQYLHQCSEKDAAIQFNGNIGILKLPSTKDEKIFSFASTIADMKDGSTDCIFQSASSSTLNWMGQMMQKITIRANDDVYLSTVNEMQKKRSDLPRTKQLEDHSKSSRPASIQKMPKNLNCKPHFFKTTLPNKSSTNDIPIRKNNRIPNLRPKEIIPNLSNQPVLSPFNNSPAINKNASPLSLEVYPPPTKKIRVSHLNKQPALQNGSHDLKNQHKTLENCTNTIETKKAKDNQPDYLKNYPPIKNPFERHKFKQDFTREYKEYVHLHKSILSRLQPITALLNNLNNLDKDSDQYKICHDDIQKEYSHLRNETKHDDEKRRCDYLHQKLAHIKNLINDFDSEYFNKE